MIRFRFFFFVFLSRIIFHNAQSDARLFRRKASCYTIGVDVRIALEIWIRSRIGALLVKERDATGTHEEMDFSLNEIIDANIIWRAFMVHLMFHERAKWIV